MRFVCVYTTGSNVWLLLKYYLHGFPEDEEKALCCNNCCGHAIVIMPRCFYVEICGSIYFLLPVYGFKHSRADLSDKWGFEGCFQVASKFALKCLFPPIIT